MTSFSSFFNSKQKSTAFFESQRYVSFKKIDPIMMKLQVNKGP